MILGVIPARGGSKGLPNKHTKLLLGKPVIGYTIEIAQKSKKLDRLVVSTEDSGIATVSRKFGVEVIKRPLDLAQDKSNIDGALKHTVETVEKEGKKVDVVVWMQANFPLREEGEIDAVIGKIIKTCADSVITVSAVDWPLERAYRLTEDRITRYYEKITQHPRRQDYQTAYISNGAVYAIRRHVLMQEPEANAPYDYFFGESRIAYVQNQFEYGIEIDDEKDFLIVEMFLQRQQLKD